MKDDRLDWVLPRYEELTALLADPESMRDMERWRRMTQEHTRLAPLADALRRRERLAAAQADTEALLSEPELQQEAQAELTRIREAREALEGELGALLASGEAAREETVMLEIRAGTGGEEAALFAAMLLRMYTRYAERKGWTARILSLSPTELGGVKEGVLSVTGPDVYRKLQFESGAHRIQRIPVTESNGKRQTSTATVVALRAVDEVECRLDPKDLRIDVYRASGHGGQYINKTDSAVRITHLPTGIVATCQDEKSQLKNREQAMRVLRARVYDELRRQRREETDRDRRERMGTGDRSERIRTYNFNDGRITDHRIGKTVYTPDAFVDGDMDAILTPLQEAMAAERLTGDARRDGIC